MESYVFNKLINFIYFLEDENEWENYGISGFYMLDSHLENFHIEFKSNLFGKTNIEKIDIVTEYVFKIYKNLLLIEKFKGADTIDSSKSSIIIYLNETYKDLIDLIIHISFSIGIDFKDIISKLKISDTFFNLESYNQLNNFLFGSENPNYSELSSLFVFNNPKSYDLFIYFYELHKDKKYYSAEISYIYRVMYKERDIKSFCKPEIFRRWLDDNNLNNPKSSLKSYHNLYLDKRYPYFKEMKMKICN